MTGVDAAASAIRSRLRSDDTPFVVAIDGRSGVGKSTLAAAIASEFGDVVVIEGDDFYGGASAAQYDARTPAENVEHVIEWRRQRPVLDDLRAGRTARWQRYDWAAFDGSMSPELASAEPAPIVILEGVYSGRPELRDLVDLAVLLVVPDDVRAEYLARREGADFRDEWFERWEAAEQHYFGWVRPEDAFDVVVRPVDSDRG